MRRRIIAAVWITGATVPLFMAAVFLFGCCALPFHGVVHKVMPLCEMAASIIHGTPAANDQGQTAPVRERQEPVKRVPVHLSHTFRLARLASTAKPIHPTPTAHYRSFISLGGIRGDRDVGLHVLVATFLI